MKFRFAYVKFRHDNELAIIETSKIRNWCQVNHDPSKCYWVPWMGNSKTKKSGDENDAEYYKAQILLLGETKKEVESTIKEGSKRIKIPKILDSSMSSMESSEDENLADVRQISRTKRSIDKVSKQKKQVTVASAAAKKGQLESLLKKKIESRAPVASSTSGDHDQISRLYKRLKVEHVTAKNELVEMRDLNVRLQKQLLDQLSRKECACQTQRQTKPSATPATPATPANPATAANPATRQEETLQDGASGQEESVVEEMSQVREDGKVSLGHGVLVETLKFELVSAEQRNSRFVKELGVLIFGSDRLRTSSLEGKVCPRYKDRPVKEALPVTGLKALNDCFEKRVKRQAISVLEKEKEMGKWRSYLREKMMDLNRKKNYMYLPFRYLLPPITSNKCEFH